MKQDRISVAHLRPFRPHHVHFLLGRFNRHLKHRAVNMGIDLMSFLCKRSFLANSQLGTLPDPGNLESGPSRLTWTFRSTPTYIATLTTPADSGLDACDAPAATSGHSHPAFLLAVEDAFASVPARHTAHHMSLTISCDSHAPRRTIREKSFYFE